jgi:hypothetical protein
LRRYRKDGGDHAFPTPRFEISRIGLYAIPIFSCPAPNGFPIASGSSLSPSLQRSNAMRNVMSFGFRPPRPYRITHGSRQMREKRTAQALMVFGVVLACVELYVVLGVL